jgi:hypothetical protein
MRLSAFGIQNAQVALLDFDDAFLGELLEKVRTTVSSLRPR